jgi:hypothetical protein
MALTNDAEIFLNRARECDALAAVSQEPYVKNLLQQMAEGYWIMLGSTHTEKDRAPTLRRPSDW